MKKKFFDWLYPPRIYCIACGNLIDKTRTYALCDTCVREIRWITKRACARCGKMLEDSWRDPLCHDCQTLNHHFRRGTACAVYEGRARDMVRAMKYQDRAWIAPFLAEILFDRLEAERAAAFALDGEILPTPDLITCVPMHEKKERRRGFNQSRLMAASLAIRLKTPFAANVIRRARQTRVMSGLGRDERQINLTGAFTAEAGGEEILRGAHVLLVDDVYTTGSTADACAEAILSEGAASVDLCVFAAGANTRKM
jgi:ComF family protein